MWFYKTKIGVFWILDKSTSEYLLGFREDPLQWYTNLEQALEDVHLQQTGCIEWDASNRYKLPGSKLDWVEGRPEDWV